MTSKEDLTNLIVEAVNARNPDLMADLGVPEPELLTDRIENLQERWPRLMMSRGDIEDRPVAVVWMPDTNEAYRPVAHIEGRDPNLVAEEPANRKVAGWESSGEIVDDGSDLV